MLGSKPKNPMSSSGQGRVGLSIISADVVITGNIRSTGDVHIDGTVEGDVMCGTLSLGASGRIQGHITAEHAKLGGHIEGSVSAHDLTIDTTAHIAGDLSYNAVSIATGAHVDGRMTHKSEDAPALKLIAQEAG